jgi:hypothetical protein
MATTDDDRRIGAVRGFDARSEDVLDTVERVELPENVALIADDYDRSIGVRDRFVWRWIYALLPAFTLDCVDPDAAAAVREQKTVLTVFVTTLDDLAEHERDRATFEEARKLPIPHQTVDRTDPAVDADALAFLGRVWSAFEEQFHDAPRYDAFAELFRYDLRGTIDAIDYSLLVSEHPVMANLEGSYRNTLHNMTMFPYADVDLTHSSGFETADLSVLRRTIWDLERMARIGNWVSTWEREVRDGDYSSGVLVAALDEGVVTPDELGGADPDRLVERIESAGIETRFLEEWNDLYDRARSRNASARSVDLDGFTRGMSTVMRYHLATRGYK